MASFPLALVLLILFAAIGGLLWSSDRLVQGAADLATRHGISPLIIGLTLVSIGTSAPEILVSATAALKGTSGLAVGNAIGSNLANTGLVLAITALIGAIHVTRKILRSEMLIMLAVTLIAGLVLYDSYLGRLESVILLALMAAFLWYTFRSGPPKEALELVEEHSEHSGSAAKAWISVAIGLGGLMLFADILVSAAVETALRAGVSELIIGATLIAVGTSLPELAASITSVLKNKSDIALGNVLGSNIFNLLIVLPVAGVIHPSAIDSAAFSRDYLVLLGISAVLALFCFIGALRQGGTFTIGRLTGATLLIIYLLYYLLVFTG